MLRLINISLTKVTRESAELLGHLGKHCGFCGSYFMQQTVETHVLKKIKRICHKLIHCYVQETERLDWAGVCVVYNYSLPKSLIFRSFLRLTSQL